MNFTRAICIALVIVLVSFLDLTNAVVEEEIKVACVLTELKPCLPAVKTGGNPSTECCGKLKEQQSCLCGYKQNPVIGPYLKNAQRILGACGVPIPTC
ncbi:hypothetical protein Bca4012_060933 [Brassica carinata]|uniref:Bifunctional inhibitor/plant lipid transfer protein/seed storage helical domain-containing protein n=1 Tax=Brassica carinata TaxID=52824 RepID=A0A8X7V6F9_BRACI|nr:hypothetical protein Bca52824_031247 [Brassica carinata]